jgi:hypothetical protein
MAAWTTTLEPHEKKRASLPQRTLALATKLHEIGAARLSGEPQPPHTGQVLIAVSGATAAAAMLLNDTAVRITEVLAESHSAPSAH